MIGKLYDMHALADLDMCILISQDKTIDKQMKPLKGNYEWINYSSPKITFLGGTGSVYFLGATALYGLAFKDHKAFQTTLLASQAYITSGVWVDLIKMIASRERPRRWYDHPNEQINWYGPFKQVTKGSLPSSAYASFPSGHVTSAFSIATVFAMQYSDRPTIPIISYTLAGLVGLSRMTEHQHWSSDVFAGACLGYLCGRQVVHHYRKITGSSSNIDESNKPLASAGLAGITTFRPAT